MLVVLILALLPLIRGGGGMAPTPGMFDAGLSLAEAEALAAEEGRVTLAFATADWCGPCQRLKRGALVDADVEMWARANAAPTLLDLTAPGAEAKAEAQRLGVGPIPAVILLRDGEEIARQEGVTTPARLLRWLEAAGE